MRNSKELKDQSVLVYRNKEDIIDFSEKSFAVIGEDCVFLYPKSKIYLHDNVKTAYGFHKDVEEESIIWTKSRFDQKTLNNKIDAIIFDQIDKLKK